MLSADIFFDLNIALFFTLCMLDNFSCFCCHLLTFFKINFFSKDSFRNTISVSNGLDPDQDQRSVSPDLDQNCLKRLSSADDKSPVNLCETGLQINKKLWRKIVNVFLSIGLNICFGCSKEPSH